MASQRPYFTLLPLPNSFASSARNPIIKKASNSGAKTVMSGNECIAYSYSNVALWRFFLSTFFPYIRHCFDGNAL